MERTFEIIPNYIDTILVSDTPANRKAFKKLEEPFKSLYKFENGECEIEMEFYDGLAIATDGSGLFMTYSKMDCIKECPRKQNAICDYTGIDDSINQYDVCMKYGILDCNPKDKAYVKSTRDSAYKLAETFILMADDIYQKIYNMSGVEGYDVAVELLHDAALRFERELDWQGGETEERDYIIELEKFEEMELARLRSIYGTGDEEEEYVDRNGRQIVVGSKVIWYDPEEEARDLKNVWTVWKMTGDIVYINIEQNGQYVGEAEVFPQELEVVG